MAKFEADLYSEYRIGYPEGLFERLKPLLGPRLSDGLSVLDLGCGTGLSSLSFLQAIPYLKELVLVDPDSEMLNRAKSQLEKIKREKVISKLSPAENFSGSVSQPVDLVLVGSAWHWMQSEPTLEQVFSVLRPGGVLFIFEYQFPKGEGSELSALNEWVRREFNLRWKMKDQKPRGSLYEITEGVRSHPEFTERARVELQLSLPHTLPEFQGAIRSQARYLEFERSLIIEERKRLREEWCEELTKIWPKNSETRFLYPFQGFVFQRRSI